MKSTRVVNHIFIVFGIALILIYGKHIIFPLIFALLIYFLIKSITKFAEKNRIIRLHFPDWIKNLLGSLIIFGVIYFCGKLLVVNLEKLIESFTTFKPNLIQIVKSLDQEYGLDISDEMHHFISDFKIDPYINPILNAVSGFMGSLIMMLFYLLFLFIEEPMFRKKLLLITKDIDKHNDTKDLLSDMQHAITHYVGLKTLISLISAVSCFVAMLLFGLHSALFWAFFIFILNFIPVVGSTFSVFLPTLFALIQFGDGTVALFLLLTLVSIQTLVGNVVEPKLMGDSLNISPLVAILALSFWGAIWGLTGMMVSVPITVIIIILLSKIESTKSIAIMLSQNGKLEK